jgi:hypothetical protein
MVREADLEHCAYWYLRTFLGSDPNWKVLARKHAKHTSHFIDLLLFKRNKPRLCIELKWNRTQIGKKDKRSLKRSIDQLNVNRAYYMATITAGPLSQQRLVPFRKIILPHNIVAVYIPPGLPKEKIKQWNADRKMFTSKMFKGIAQHK